MNHRKSLNVNETKPSPAQMRARALRENRRRRIDLLSLQKLPVEKLETTFRRIASGEIRLIGLREKPEQRPAFVGITEED